MAKITHASNNVCMTDDKPKQKGSADDKSHPGVRKIKAFSLVNTTDINIKPIKLLNKLLNV